MCTIKAEVFITLKTDKNNIKVYKLIHSITHTCAHTLDRVIKWYFIRGKQLVV